MKLERTAPNKRNSVNIKMRKMRVVRDEARLKAFYSPTIYPTSYMEKLFEGPYLRKPIIVDLKVIICSDQYQMRSLIPSLCNFQKATVRLSSFSLKI